MVIQHKAKRLDTGEEVKGVVTIMWGRHHIITEADENTAYPVQEETIEPCITGECEGCTSSEEDCYYCMRAYSDCYETKH